MKKTFFGLCSSVTTLVIVSSLFTTVAHAQTAAHPVVTSIATPSISSSVISTTPTSTIVRYAATFTAKIAAVDGNIVLGLPNSPVPAFNIGAPSSFFFKNSSAVDYHTFSPIISYALPSATTTILNSKYFMVPKGGEVVLPVTYSFYVYNPGASTFGVRLAGLMYSTATSTATSSFQVATFTDMCTANAVCSSNPPANPVVAPVMGFTPSVVASGASTAMSFAIPADAVRAPLTFVCPTGITAVVDSLKYDLCGGKPFYVGSGVSQFSVTFTNATANSVSLNPSVTVSYTDHPGVNLTAKATITVSPKPNKNQTSMINQNFSDFTANAIGGAVNVFSAIRSVLFGN